MKRIKLKVSFIGRLFDKRMIFRWFFFEKNHDLNKTIIVEGTGRSGTTWLADLLAEILHYRMILEPFQPKRVKDFKNLKYKEYIPPDYQNFDYFKSFEKILSGRVKNIWVNKDNRVFRPNGRIIKSIRASYFLKWLRNNFPNIPIIYIIRHPCAVVLSRARLGWSETELDLLLEQKSLIKDHLEPYIDIISNAETLIQKNACIWCIQNLIPLKTMNPNDWIITSYEQLFLNPLTEINKILDYLGIEKELNNKNLKSKISIHATRSSAIVSDTNPLEAWKKKLSKEEINEILTIVKKFSLDWIYDENIMPKKEFY